MTLRWLTMQGSLTGAGFASYLPCVGITGDQRFIEFCIIAIDVVEKTNLIFLVHRSRAVDNQNWNSRGQVHLKIIFVAVHRGLHPLQIPARIVSQHPSHEVFGLLYSDAS